MMEPMVNTDKNHSSGESPDDDASSLADAIAAHLELKEEHGADPSEVELERASALGPTVREIDQANERPADHALPPESTEPPIPEPPSADEQKSEPLVEEPITADPADAAINFAEVPRHAQPEPEQPPAAEPPTENTGTIEFDWKSSDQPSDQPSEDQQQTQPPPSQHDLLEDTPDFFEETPEHDKLWFDEKPPKKFDF
jgi:hypothetical protein